VHPELFDLGFFVIPSFLAAAVVGALLSFWVALQLVRKKGWDRMEFFSYAVFSVLAFWLGSVLYRLFFTFLNNPENFLNEIGSLRVLVQKSGTSIIGGILGFILFSVLYLKRVGLPFWGTMDIAFTTIPLSQAFGRIGCFLGGCCYGCPTDSWLGVIFPKLSQAVHPTQLYESVLNLVNFAVLYILYKKRRFEGRIFALYLINYSVIRFVVEFWRGDSYRGFVIRGMSPWTSLSIPQAMCLFGFAAGAIIYLHRKARA
jgi:phosphatidylglycerol:prolipoprotein diacylglycerol transferase